MRRPKVSLNQQLKNDTWKRMHQVIFVSIWAACFAVIASCGGGGGSVQAQEDIVWVDSLPYTINEPGTYRFARDFHVTGDGISILSDNVILDLNGFSLHGPFDVNNQSFGISSFGYSNIIVRNGHVFGFMYAIYLSDFMSQDPVSFEMSTNGGHIVEDLHIQLATFRGVRVEGHNNIVRNNVIGLVGGTGVYENAYAMAIESFGPNTVVKRNQIFEVRGTGSCDIGEGVGISMSSFNDGSLIYGNQIINYSHEVVESNKVVPESRSTYGIWVGGNNGEYVTLEANNISNFIYGITFKRSAAGIFTRNTALNALVPFYLPTLDGTPNAEIGENNYCDLAADQFVHTRQMPGCVEVVEMNYLIGFLPDRPCSSEESLMNKSFF